MSHKAASKPRRRQETGEHEEQRCLSGSVGADESGDGACAQRHVRIGNGGVLTERARQSSR